MEKTNILPLKGIRVLDCSHVIAGPFCTLTLANAGAEIIKIESPSTGEKSRNLGPYKSTDSGKLFGGMFVRMNRNKKSVALDLKHPKGQELFKKLVVNCDVVIENFRTGTMKRFGLDYENLRKINEKLIMVSMTGYGQPAEGNIYANRPSFNLIAQAMGGIMAVTGDPKYPPAECGVPIGDLIPGILAAYGIMLALYYRNMTGQGQSLDLAMYDVMALMAERNINLLQLTGVDLGREEVLLAPHSSFKCKDGYFAIDCYTQKDWRNICKAIGAPQLAQDPRFDSGEKRVKLVDSIIRPAIEEWAANYTKEEATDLMLAVDIPAGPVQSAKDLLQCPNLKMRGMLRDLDIPGLGRITYPGDPLNFSEIPKTELKPPPALGEHTREVLQDLLGLNEMTINDLCNEGAISVKQQ